MLSSSVTITGATVVTRSVVPVSLPVTMMVPLLLLLLLSPDISTSATVSHLSQTDLSTFNDMSGIDTDKYAADSLTSIDTYLDKCPAFVTSLTNYFCDGRLFSCVNRCGLSNSPDVDCFCDSKCLVYGDCCDDFVEQCPSYAGRSLGGDHRLSAMTLKEAKTECWNGLRVISGKGADKENLDVHEEDLRKPLVSHGASLHFKTMDIHDAFKIQSESLMRMNMDDVMEWGRSIYLLHNSMSCEDLEEFVNTGHVSSFGDLKQSLQVRIVDVPPKGLTGRKCSDEYVYEAICEQNMNSENCELPEMFGFHRPKRINCSLDTHTANSNNNNVFDSKMERGIGTNSGSQVRSFRMNGNSNVNTDDNGTNVDIDPTIREDEDQTKGVVPTPSTDFAQFEDTPVTQTLNTSGNSFPQPHRWANIRAMSPSSATNSTTNDTFQGFESLIIRFEDDPGQPDDLFKGVRFHKDPPHPSETNELERGHDHDDDSSTDASVADWGIHNDHTEDGNDTCTVKSHQPMEHQNIYSQIHDSQFLKVETVEFRNINHNIDIFVPNPEASVERIFCNSSMGHEVDVDWGDVDRQSGTCHIAVVCKPGFVPIGLTCRRPSRLAFEVFGSRNMSLQFLALRVVEFVLTTEFTEAFPPQPNWERRTEIGLSHEPKAMTLFNNGLDMYLDPPGLFRYDGGQLPMTRVLRETLGNNPWFLTRTDELDVKGIDLCLVVNKASLYDDGGWLVCDRLLFDDGRDTECTQRLVSSGIKMRYADSLVNSQGCMVARGVASRLRGIHVLNVMLIIIFLIY